MTDEMEEHNDDVLPEHPSGNTTLEIQDIVSKAAATVLPEHHDEG